ncbi:hypothetical protein EDC04DRAFT_3089055 [Pisolithus marmoratus]|nr:hypothetical protein EDC04DRAFT_3089055 [Pisolithus marmoratus]
MGNVESSGDRSERGGEVGVVDAALGFTPFEYMAVCRNSEGITSAHSGGPSGHLPHRQSPCYHRHYALPLPDPAPLLQLIIDASVPTLSRSRDHRDLHRLHRPKPQLTSVTNIGLHRARGVGKTVVLPVGLATLQADCFNNSDVIRFVLNSNGPKWDRVEPAAPSHGVRHRHDTVTFGRDPTCRYYSPVSLVCAGYVSGIGQRITTPSTRFRQPSPHA